MKPRAVVPALAVLAVLVLGTTTSASTWTGPTATPPGNNAAAPLNVGSVGQVKNGTIGVNGIAVYGNSLISPLTGVGGYLNFDYTTGGTSGTGSIGYGIRDNAGTLEFKNVGGSWASIQSTVQTLVSGGSGQWVNGSSGAIYYNGGNVGIGTSAPGYPLQIVGPTSNWAEVINWPPGTPNGYGILVGTGANYYSEFKNASGYYALLADSSYGLYTNGNVYASDVYSSAGNKWLSNAAISNGAQFGVAAIDNIFGPTPTMCPSGAVVVGVGPCAPSAYNGYTNCAITCQWIR